MLGRLIASLQKTIVLTATPERFIFASAGREATIDTVLRVSPDGRILGFREGGRWHEGEVLRLFGPGGEVADERALIALCRHGLAAALGPWAGLALRPRVVVRSDEGVRMSPEAFTRVLRSAGAATVEFPPR